MKKRSTPDLGKSEWKNNGSLMNKPTRGWVHLDSSLAQGVTYIAKYVGCVKILQSVKSVSLEDRGNIIRIAMAKCCDKAGLIKHKKKHKIPHTISKAFGDIFTGYCGENILVTISKSSIKIVLERTGVLICDHYVENISFASAGEKEYSSYVSYIAKDNIFERACFVLECALDIKTEVIQTIGQAFEAKYKEFIKRPLQAAEVPEKFTQPIFPEEAPMDQTPTLGYTQITRKDTIESTSSGEYNCLQRGDLPQRNNPSDNYDKLNKGHDYATPRPDVLPLVSGGNYSEIGSRGDYAAIYDNPMASPTTRDQILIDFNDNSHQYQLPGLGRPEATYDNPQERHTGRPEATYDNPQERQTARPEATYDNPQERQTARPEATYDNPKQVMQLARNEAIQAKTTWEQFDEEPTAPPAPIPEPHKYSDPSGYLVPKISPCLSNKYAALNNPEQDENDYQSPQEDAGDYQHPTETEYQHPDTHYQMPKPVQRQRPKSEVGSLDDKSWYHGHISRMEAEMLIDKDGQFLVRESSSTKGQYVLSGMRDGQHRHLLLVDPEGQVRTKDRTFATVEELIVYHKGNNIPIISGGSEVHIASQVSRASMKGIDDDSMEI